MKFFSDELMQRLDNLEVEQNRQTRDLEQFRSFEREIQELEEKLAKINGWIVKSKTSTAFMGSHDLKEIERIETEVIHAQEEEETSADARERAYFEEIRRLKLELAQKRNIVENSIVSAIQTIQKTQDQNRISEKVASPPPRAIPSESTTRKQREVITATVTDTATAVKSAPRIETALYRRVINSTVKKSSPTIIRRGYFIRLVFDPKSPTEWSDAAAGWREIGSGTCYTTLQQAQKQVQRLKQRWPTHPFKIIKV